MASQDHHVMSMAESTSHKEEAPRVEVEFVEDNIEVNLSTSSSDTIVLDSDDQDKEILNVSAISELSSDIPGEPETIATPTTNTSTNEVLDFPTRVPRTTSQLQYDLSEEDNMLFTSNSRPTPTHIYEEEPPLLLAEGDTKSLEEAERAEQVLGSALHLVEQRTSLVALQRATKSDAQELGRRVWNLPDFVNGVAKDGPPVLTAQDDASIRSWASQITETSFLRVAKGDPAILIQKSWDSLAASNSFQEDIPGNPSSLPALLLPGTPSRNQKEAPAPTNQEFTTPPRNIQAENLKDAPTSPLATEEPGERDWSRLRHTLQAEEDGSAMAQAPSHKQPSRPIVQGNDDILKEASESEPLKKQTRPQGKSTFKTIRRSLRLARMNKKAAASKKAKPSSILAGFPNVPKEEETMEDGPRVEVEHVEDNIEVNLSTNSDDTIFPESREEDKENITANAVAEPSPTNSGEEKRIDTPNTSSEKKKDTEPSPETPTVQDDTPASNTTSVEAGTAKTFPAIAAVDKSTAAPNTGSGEEEPSNLDAAATSSLPAWLPRSIPLFQFDLSEADTNMLFPSTSKPRPTHIYEEEPPVLLADAEEDARSLEEAEQTEQVLGSALQLVEQKTSALALQRATRSDAQELGRRVVKLPEFSNSASKDGPPILTADDDASIRSWASQITETSFLKAAKGDPAILIQKSWDSLSCSNHGEEDLKESKAASVTVTTDTSQKQTSSSTRQLQIIGISKDTASLPRATGERGDRNWSKLRETLQTEQDGTAVAEEISASKSKKPNRPTKPLKKDGTAIAQAPSHKQPSRPIVQGNDDILKEASESEPLKKQTRPQGKSTFKTIRRSLRLARMNKKAAASKKAKPSSILAGFPNVPKQEETMEDGPRVEVEHVEDNIEVNLSTNSDDTIFPESREEDKENITANAVAEPSPTNSGEEKRIDTPNTSSEKEQKETEPSPETPTVQDDTPASNTTSVEAGTAKTFPAIAAVDKSTAAPNTGSGEEEPSNLDAAATSSLPAWLPRSIPLFQFDLSEADTNMLFPSTSKPRPTHIYEEEPPVLLADAEEDARSLEEAEQTEQVLGSALQLVEQKTSALALQRATRSDAQELGRRVVKLPEFSNSASKDGPPILTADDDASIRSWASQITETSFLKAAKGDPAILIQKSWDSLSCSNHGEEDLKESKAASVTVTTDTSQKQTSSSTRQLQIIGISKDTASLPRATGERGDRNWSKLRETLQTEQDGTAVAEEISASKSKKPNRPTKPLKKDGTAIAQAPSHKQPSRPIVQGNDDILKEASESEPLKKQTRPQGKSTFKTIRRSLRLARMNKKAAASKKAKPSSILAGFPNVPKEEETMEDGPRVEVEHVEDNIEVNLSTNSDDTIFPESREEDKENITANAVAEPSPTNSGEEKRIDTPNTSSEKEQKETEPSPETPTVQDDTPASNTTSVEAGTAKTFPAIAAVDKSTAAPNTGSGEEEPSNLDAAATSSLPAWLPRSIPLFQFDLSEADTNMLFPSTSKPRPTHIYEEEPPVLLADAEEDARSLEEAEQTEQVLGSALQLVEQKTSALALQRATRSDAQELGRRVVKLPEFSNSASKDGPPILTADDDASIRSWASQITETSFLKAAKGDPAILIQKSWDSLSCSNHGEEDLKESKAASVTVTTDTSQKQTSSSTRQLQIIGISKDTASLPRATGERGDRNWSKLRETLQTEQDGTAVAEEISASKSKKPNRPTKPAKKAAPKSATESEALKKQSRAQGKSGLKTIRKSLGLSKTNKKATTSTKTKAPSILDSFKEAVSSMVESRGASRPGDEGYQVNIRVEDLTQVNESYETGSTEIETVDDMMDDSVVEADSMEVVYLLGEKPDGSLDIFPPFPTNRLQL